MKKYFAPFLLVISWIFLLNTTEVNAQCTTLGQTPFTAFPVCGLDTFLQQNVPYCVNNEIPVPGCTGVVYSDKNPFWYRFTCYETGTLGFMINPIEGNEDYDWQVFDITDRNPGDVYTDASLFVVANWAGTYTPTGAGLSGLNMVECASDPNQIPPVTTISRMPIILKGHTYLLMVSHYTDSQQGYQLSFGGGTASITDPIDPFVVAAVPSCDATQITVALSKKMKCASLAADGSDFTIPGISQQIIAATGIGCDSSFDLDSVILQFDSPIPAGNYQLVVKTGSDQNTLLDNCNKQIPVNNQVSLAVLPKQPTPFDSIAPVACAPAFVDLVFEKNINCSSIDPNGSDFTITGSYPVLINSAEGICVAGLSKIVRIHFDQPLYQDGAFTVSLKPGFDGNTIIDECGEETLPATIDFMVKDTVSADFTYQVFSGCSMDSVQFTNNGGISITSWQWTFDSLLFSDVQNPKMYYAVFGEKNASLIVTNGFCSDTVNTAFYLDHDSLTAAFSGPSVYCPDDMAVFKDSSIGKIIGWNWQFGNGNTSFDQEPSPQFYPKADNDRLFPVSLIVESDKRCFDTALLYIKVVNNCFIAVPSAFTPNQDGLNDYLYPLNAYKATQLQFRVYNRWGQQVFQTSDWTKKWDGSINGMQQPAGTYVWMLEFVDESRTKVFKKGTTVLIR